MLLRFLLPIALFACLLFPMPSDNEPPIIPIGLDAYRMWDRWPYQRIGARAHMRSTYDRRGGNEAADASHFLYQLADDNNVSLDVEGPGILYFVRTNHWHGSPWRYVVDSREQIVQETSTKDPTKPVENSIFEPAALFPNPLTWTWSITKGADLNWVPIPFEKSFRLGYSRTHYGTGYYLYHHYLDGAKLSHPLRAWDGRTPPDSGVLDLLRRAGTDIAPPAGSPGVEERSVTTSVPSEGKQTLEVAAGQPRMVRKIELSVPREAALSLGKCRIRVYWDGRKEPSIDAPVALFFGAGTLYNRDEREYLVKALPASIRFHGAQVTLACYFPMPFFRSMRAELIGNGRTPAPYVRWTVRTEPLDAPPNHVGYFHATYRDHPNPEPGKDLVLLDTRKVEGGGDWSGSFVGTSWIFSHNAVLTTLEGDPRFYFDDSEGPQGYGTGTEEWGGGGDYWGGRNMTLPFAGHPCGAPSAKDAKNDEDKIQSAYRFLLADLMPFGKNARITLEHGGTNESTERYESVTYWYGIPSPSLVLSDTLQVGDPASENAHGYHAPLTSPSYELTSRYEWGVDTIRGREVFPPHTDRGRIHTSTSEFTLILDPRNLGVLLRRKLDYAYPNQRAEVYVADVNDSGKPGKWSKAGIWYTAGSNTCVYSNPPHELGATQHNVQTSNRRFRDDEFLIGRNLTQGRNRIRVQIRFTPVTVPLFPNYPIPPLAWSEMRYSAYSYVMPAFNPHD